MPPLTKSTDLDVKYRPKTIAEVIGQPDAVKAIRAWGANIPRAVLFYGQTGGGKTTLTRAITTELLGVPLNDFMNLQVINCGTVDEPTNFVRELNKQMSGSPMGGAKKRVWIFDEIQVWVRSKGAQEAMLEVLEDPPSHVQFFLTTTDPGKVIKPLLGRCTPIEIKPLQPADVKLVVKRAAEGEGVKLDAETAEGIVERASGSARNALKLLEKVIHISDPKERAAALGPSYKEDQEVFGLVRVLLPWQGAPNWPAVAKILVQLKEQEEDAEGIRRMIIASARGMMLKGRDGGALGYKAIQCMREPYYDAPTAHAFLAADCYKICFGK